jgi:hypothetical protein
VAAGAAAVVASVGVVAAADKTVPSTFLIP